ILVNASTFTHEIGYSSQFINWGIRTGFFIDASKKEGRVITILEDPSITSRPGLSKFWFVAGNYNLRVYRPGKRPAEEPEAKADSTTAFDDYYKGADAESASH